MIETNALSFEERKEILTKTNIDNLKYWFDNNEYEGEHFEAFVDYLYDNDEDYLTDYITDFIADTEKHNDENFIDICKELDIDLEGKAGIIADYYQGRSWQREAETFVDCTIRFLNNDEEEDVTIALKSLDELGWEEGGHKDDEIFYYCDSLEDFFNLCDEDYTCEDFVVTDVCIYYDEL